MNTPLDIWKSQATKTVDVRPDLQRGDEPFVRIMEAAEATRPGEILAIIAPFEPAPLYGRGSILPTLAVALAQTMEEHQRNEKKAVQPAHIVLSRPDQKIGPTIAAPGLAQTRQAVPLSVPLLFLLTGISAATLFSVLLPWNISEALLAPDFPHVLTLAHMLTPGFLTMAIMGGSQRNTFPIRKATTRVPTHHPHFPRLYYDDDDQSQSVHRRGGSGCGGG